MGNNKDIARIDWEHHEVHDGDTYQVFFEDITLDDNATINFAFKTPPATTKQIHMVVEYATKVGGQMTVLEAPTWTAQSGTKIVPINMNRISTKTSSILGNETSTVYTANEIALNVTTILTTNATVVESDAVYGSKWAGGARGTKEIILEGDTLYVVLFTAEGASNFGHLKMRWYEYLPNVI